MRIYTGNFDSILFLGVTPFLNLEIWPKWKIFLIQFVSTTPLKLLNRISWNFVVVKGIPCRCAYLQEIFIQFFFLWIMPFLNLEIWPKWKILLKQFVSATPLKPLNRILWNFVVMKDIIYRYAYHRKFWLNFFSRNYACFELWNWTKMKDTTETVRQRNSTETAQQNFVKLCCYEGHKV